MEGVLRSAIGQMQRPLAAGCESSHNKECKCSKVQQSAASPGAYAGRHPLERFGPSALRTLLAPAIQLWCCPSTSSLARNASFAKMHDRQTSAQSAHPSRPASRWLIWRSIEADAAATGTCEAVDPRGVVPGGHVAGDDVHNDAAGKSTGGPPEGMPGTCLLLDANAASIFTV
ncbi:hypothetical protein L207DRAFT_578244 [Hyaloscypha variabilis F]|uniref:Uncharacterized protein n=1 Tax=Hyaloscypha variabilis (strain UAMH 11265 / GT02V1 / F) TaxID=1149755 RepID=A0A2J6S3K2_HYAVF|nr:hypothetical protein L207DRAFT_578244 [Hyaloscypha variabilis F]